MADFRQEYCELSNTSKGSLHNTLKGLLSKNYHSSIEKASTHSNLNNTLMEGCFQRIAPNLDPLEFVQDWHNWDTSWRRKRGKSLATALRMLLSEQVGLQRYEIISGYKISTISRIIVGIQAADDEVMRDEDSHVPLTLPPDIDLPLEDPPPLPQNPEQLFERVYGFTETSKIFSEFGDGKDHFAVYVFNCTPPPDNRKKAIWQLRRDVWAKEKEEKSLKGAKEHAGHALNEGKSIYYVGMTEDLKDRLYRHSVGSSAGGARFMNLFKPRGLVDVHWFSTKDEAKSNEKRIATKINQEDSAFAYYN